MEFVIIALLVINILTNIYLVKNLNPIIAVEPIIHVELSAPETVEVEKPVTVKADNERFQAWKNVTEEPVKAAASPHKPPPLPGPLERPGGFAR